VIAADQVQRRALDPASSVWVSASAGTGKTKVLTERLLTLMLDGTDPSRLLCLTFTRAAAAEMVDGLRDAVVSDEACWDRGDVRAVRRALAVVHGVEVEILAGVEAVGPAGDVVVATPDLDHVDQIIVSGRQIPVLPLSAMQVLLDATGKRERAAMVANVLGGKPGGAGT